MANAASANQNGSQSFIPISAANTLDLSAHSSASLNASFGAVDFQDGSFQVGGAGDVAANPQQSTQTQTLPSGLFGGSGSSSSSLSWPLIAGLALVAYYVMKHH
jgi:hypothetical protein